MPFKAAKCPNCAGDIQVPDDRDNAKCMYCGSDIIVREAIKAAAGGVDIGNLLVLAKHAEDCRNFEEAYQYYSNVLQFDSNNIDAWVGKGLTSHTITINPDKYSGPHIERDCKSAFQCFKKAIIISAEKLKTQEKIISGILKTYDLFHRGIKHPVNFDLCNFAKITPTSLRHVNRINNDNFEYFSFVAEIDNTNIVGILNRAILEPSFEKSIEIYQQAISYSGYSCDIINSISESIIAGFKPWYIGSKYPDEAAVKGYSEFYYSLNPGNATLDKIFIEKIHYYCKISHRSSEVDGCEIKDVITYTYCFKDEVVKARYFELVNKIKKVEPNYVPPVINDKGKCFIATAAYGSPMACEVVMLREFRDSCLKLSRPGRCFIKLYYRLSPPIADVIAKSQCLRAISRQILRPIVFLARRFTV